MIFARFTTTTGIHEKLLTLPDDLEIYPGHFFGSLCGAGLSGKPSIDIYQRPKNG